MHAHLVFVTKYRREIFTKAILDDLRSIFTRVCVVAAPLHAGSCSSTLSKLSVNALNNSRRRIRVKGMGGLPSTLSLSDLTGVCTKDKIRSEIGLVQEGSGGYIRDDKGNQSPSFALCLNRTILIKF